MKTIPMAHGDLTLPAIVQGCMRIADMPVPEVERLIETCLSLGITMFDHADIYAGGRSEEVFGKALQNRPELREGILLQSKCGINPKLGLYDFSKEHILQSVDGSLARLGVERLDVLLLHRPDALMEPEEVAAAFDRLEAQGKVAHFGVSNQNPSQIQLLQKAVRQPLCFNQLQFSIAHTGMIDQGINVNIASGGAVDRDGGILNYCMLHDITIQAWSPFQYGFFEGVFVDNPKFAELKEAMDAIALAHGVSTQAVAVAFILRHPARMQVIIGTTNLSRIQASAQGDFALSREEWYRLYKAMGNPIP